MAYTNTCEDCGNLDLNERKNCYSDSFYCEWYKTYYPKNSDICNHFTSRETTGGCYITTIVHDVLGKKDNCHVLKELRGFRDNVLQKNKKYREILFHYDTIGPIISESIKEDYDKEFCTLIYNKYLVPISSMIEKKNYLGAVVNYQNLVSNLEIYYNISEPNIEVNYNYKKGGHGKLYVK